MPQHRNARILVDGASLDLGAVEDLPLTLTYSLEDRENFQNKTPNRALSVKVPATTNNDAVSNNFTNPAVDDLTPNQTYRSNRPAVIEANGYEVLKGKAFLQSGKHTRQPTQYEYNFFGGNGDWVIDLKETTMYDLIRDIQFVWNKETVVNSWSFDGTNPQLPFVFAPVRYGEQLIPVISYDADGNQTSRIEDYNMKVEYMKPALSKYWLIYRMFKLLGYRIKSNFMDSPYFRRQVMPWTWGNYLQSDGTKLDALKFLAKSTESAVLHHEDFTGFLDVKATNDTINGAFDNSGTYSYVAPMMRWTYPTTPELNFGKLTAGFYLNCFTQATVTANSNVELRAQWFRNGSKISYENDNGNGSLLLSLKAPLIGKRMFGPGAIEQWIQMDVQPGDVVECKLYAHTFDSGAGRANMSVTIDAFQLEYFRIPLGGTVNFDNYTGFKKWKALDLLGGTFDEFNLTIGTDTVNKVVYIEPQHPYSTTSNLADKSGGYFNGKTLDWSKKQDFEKESEMSLYSDVERELLFKYKEDGNDGTYKVVADRHIAIPGMGKYVFPDRFKKGKNEVENRFFSAVMHYDAVQWSGIAGGANAYPQMVALLPENISNASRSEAMNTFLPKSCYYKGLVSDFGWVFDGQKMYSFPYMFAVNYKSGGENDPILSYCDEQIGPDGAEVIGAGLIRRFYLQRLEIMRNGQYYRTFIQLNNNDVANFLHREHVVIRGQRWEVVEINNYSPFKDESTEVFLRRWVPIRPADITTVPDV